MSTHLSKLIPSGTPFGKLTVSRLAPKPDDGVREGRYYECSCECGETIVVSARNLARGKESCGCVRGPIGRPPGSGATHGESASRLNAVWRNMKNRCDCPTNPSFANYGGRGITVCREWQDSYIAFAEWSRANGYVEGLDIDRIDNNAGYSPDNCRWTTRMVNQRNRRNNVTLTAFGETKCLAEWILDPRCHLACAKSLKNRVDRGLSPEDAVSMPTE